MPKFRPDLFARLQDIAEKQVPAKLKPIVDDGMWWQCPFVSVEEMLPYVYA